MNVVNKSPIKRFHTGLNSVVLQGKNGICRDRNIHVYATLIHQLSKQPDVEVFANLSAGMWALPSGAGAVSVSASVAGAGAGAAEVTTPAAHIPSRRHPPPARVIHQRRTERGRGGDGPRRAAIPGEHRAANCDTIPAQRRHRHASSHRETPGRARPTPSREPAGQGERQAATANIERDIPKRRDGGETSRKESMTRHERTLVGE